MVEQGKYSLYCPICDEVNYIIYSGKRKELECDSCSAKLETVEYADKLRLDTWTNKDQLRRIIASGTNRIHDLTEEVHDLQKEIDQLTLFHGKLIHSLKDSEARRQEIFSQLHELIDIFAKAFGFSVCHDITHEKIVEEFQKRLNRRNETK